MTIIDARARFREKRHRDFEMSHPRMTNQYPRRFEDAFLYPVPTYDDDVIAEAIALFCGVRNSP